MEQHRYDPARLPEGGCVILIGMAGTGKTTVGRHLSQAMDWPQVDTDHMIEAYYGAKLQAVVDSMGREEFVHTEDRLVASLAARRCIVSTGGSVIYGPAAMARLRAMGPRIFLKASLGVILRRMAANMSRGLAITPGQTIDNLFAERQPLYHAAADLTVDTDSLPPEACAQRILAWLKGDG